MFGRNSRFMQFINIYRHITILEFFNFLNANSLGPTKNYKRSTFSLIDPIVKTIYLTKFGCLIFRCNTFSSSIWKMGWTKKPVILEGYTSLPNNKLKSYITKQSGQINTRQIWYFMKAKRRQLMTAHKVLLLRFLLFAEKKSLNSDSHLP